MPALSLRLGFALPTIAMNLKMQEQIIQHLPGANDWALICA